MERISHDLFGIAIPDIEVNGKREEKDITRVHVRFREHEGEVIIKNEEWADDGVEWDVCPSEWESLESDIQDWLGSQCIL